MEGSRFHGERVRRGSRIAAKFERQERLLEEENNETSERNESICRRESSSRPVGAEESQRIWRSRLLE
jgi:hypothetical protein